VLGFETRDRLRLTSTFHSGFVTLQSAAIDLRMSMFTLQKTCVPSSALSSNRIRNGMTLRPGLSLTRRFSPTPTKNVPQSTI
jgi:hypothetical protein